MILTLKDKDMKFKRDFVELIKHTILKIKTIIILLIVKRLNIYYFMIQGKITLFIMIIQEKICFGLNCNNNTILNLEIISDDIKLYIFI